MSAIIALGILHAQCLFAQTPITLENGKLKLQWTNSRQGYRLQLISLKEGKKQIALNHPLGEYTVLYTAEKPNDQPLLNLVGEKARLFPDTIYDHIYDNWKVALSAVPLNVAGEAKYFFPSSAKSEGKKLLFTKENGEFMLSAKWFLDPKYPQDIQVEILLKAKKSGYFAISTPTLATFLPAELNWGIIPGYFQGNKLAEDLVSAYAYGHGIPNRPVLVRERAASTLSPIITNNQGISLAVIPAPGQGRDPWELDKNTQKVWQLGLALMNRQGKLTPEIYHPVLGEKGSYLKKEESCTFNFRYSLTVSDWYQPYQHAVNDIYKFKDVLALKNTKQSLSDRIFAMTKYLK
ncbi:MAG: glycerophosphoryl diester phosphodiesterase, partial [Chryseobacterium sp.]